VGSGFVDSFARPGRNITGFTLFEASLGGKWLGLLREIAPGVGRVGMLFNPNTAASGTSGGIYLRAIETSAQATGVKLLTLPVHNPAGIEPAIHSLALEPGGGMLVMPNLFTVFHRRRIVELATTQKVPAVYPYRYFVTEGGLAAYGVDSADLFRRAALYVDRLLRGAKVDELPVQAPTKFELAINLKTAAALGLTVPPTLLARADEVVE
jgi:putative ABC transport system substrate-binding protein